MSSSPTKLRAGNRPDPTNKSCSGKVYLGVLIVVKFTNLILHFNGYFAHTFLVWLLEDPVAVRVNLLENLGRGTIGLQMFCLVIARKTERDIR